MARSYRERWEPDLSGIRLRQEPDLRASWDDDPGGAAGECVPPMDVLETTEGVELVLDLPGVSPGDLQIVLSHATLVIAGRKVPHACSHRDAAFHLAERSFGRFVRAVRLSGAFDGGRARATLARGELRIALPRVEERRGRDIRIPVTAADAGDPSAR